MTMLYEELLKTGLPSLARIVTTMVAYDAAKGEHRFGHVTNSLVSRIEQALPTAYGSIDSGAASTQLEVWASVSQRFALNGQ